MAESQKGTPPINQKQKSSALDEEIGKEFLCSWKSMSLIEDDPLNFSFDTVPKGKKKTFNFEKLDMDFNLDCDFDKLSSFKVDMPDLDFSSPPQKPVKPKKRCEEESSSANIQRKQDRFNFSFDFNELDGFNFESCLMKDGKDASKTQDSKRVTREQSQDQGSKLNMTEGNAGYDDSLDMQLPAGKSVGISDVEILIGGQGDLNFINEGSASKSVNPENLVTSHGGGTSPGKTKIMSAEDTDQQKSIHESSICKEQYAQQLKPDLPVQTVHPNDSNVDDVTDISEVKLKMKTCSLGTEERNVSSGEQIGVDKLGSILGSDVEKSPGNNSPPLHICGSDDNDGERYELGGDAALKDMNDSEPAEPVEVDLDIKDISTKNDSRKIADDMKGIVENSSMSNHPVVPLGREPVVDARLPEKEKGGILSMSYPKPKKTVFQLHQTSGTEFSSFGSKRDGCLRSSSDKGEGFNTNNGSKLVGTTISAAKELTKSQPILLGSKNNVNNFGKIGGSSDYDDALERGKGIENLTPPDKEVTKNEPVLLGSEKNVRGHHISSLTEETTECKNVQSRVNPKLMLSSMESLRSSEIILTERNKFCHIKAGKKSPDLSSMRAARITGAGKALSSSICRSPVTCLGKFNQNTGAQGNTELKIERPVDTNKKIMSQALSLKRKRIEASNADSESLQPLKRLSESASESSNSKVQLERVLDEQHDTNEVCIRRIWSGSNAKHITSDRPTSGPESPLGVNMMELEIPLAVDNDENVKKAEAYTKELEKISNMLKKKHEEAKEILVRALVSNNNLLMLKHPIYEEKIQKIQKFADQLLSKELRTCSVGSTIFRST